LLRASFRLLGSAYTEEVLFLMRITSSRKALNPHVQIHERREKDFCWHTSKLQRDLFMSMSIILEHISSTRDRLEIVLLFISIFHIGSFVSWSILIFLCNIHSAIWLVVYIATNISKIIKYFWQMTSMCQT